MKNIESIIGTFCPTHETYPLPTVSTVKDPFRECQRLNCSIKLVQVLRPPSLLLSHGEVKSIEISASSTEIGDTQIFNSA